MEVMPLTGGLGIRSRSMVSDRPKPMVLIEGRSLVEYVTRELVRRRITSIIFAVGYRGSMVKEHSGNGDRFGFHASYAHGETLLGTAGAIRNAGRLTTQDRFHVLSVDTFYQIDYAQLSKIMDVQGLNMALVPREVEDVSRYGQTIPGRERILTAFNEKTEETRTGTTNGGVYLMKRELLDRIPKRKVSLENDMIPRWLGEEKRLEGFVNDGYFTDIGIPEAYYQFQEDVRRKVIW